MISTGNFIAQSCGPLEFVKSPEKGTPGVKVNLELKSGSNNGERIEWIGWLTDSTTLRTGEALALMGYDGSDPDTVKRKQVSVVIEHETYTNKAGEQKERARVAWINDPSGGGRMDPMSATEVAGAKDRLKAAMAASRAKAAKPVAKEDEPRF